MVCEVLFYKKLAVNRLTLLWFLASPPIFIVEIRDNGYVKFTLGTNYFGGKQEGGPKACFFFLFFRLHWFPRNIRWRDLSRRNCCGKWKISGNATVSDHWTYRRRLEGNKLSFGRNTNLVILFGSFIFFLFLRQFRNFFSLTC